MEAWRISEQKEISSHKQEKIYYQTITDSFISKTVYGFPLEFKCPSPVADWNFLEEVHIQQ